MKQLLYIDLFCGAGGTSTGVESATQAEQKKYIGNAVETHVACALCYSLSAEINGIAS